jgi:sec-independent protein translocase protein TatA
MNILIAGFFGGWEIVLILAVVLILFGAKKLPELAKGLGSGIKEFKKATREVSDELTNAMDDHTPPPRRLPPQVTTSEPHPAPPETVHQTPPVTKVV